MKFGEGEGEEKGKKRIWCGVFIYLLFIEVRWFAFLFFFAKDGWLDN